jgi:hypothetical protein
MAQETYNYFMQVTQSVPENDRVQWEQDIHIAESCRLIDRGAMDILGVREPPRGVQPTPLSQARDSTSVEEWIQMALDIEIKQ